MKPDRWEFVKHDDGSYAVLQNGEQLHDSIPERWLEDELAKYGFCGQEYGNIRQQLQERARALVVLNTAFRD